MDLAVSCSESFSSLCAVIFVIYEEIPAMNKDCGNVSNVPFLYLYFVIGNRTLFPELGIAETKSHLKLLFKSVFESINFT